MPLELVAIALISLFIGGQINRGIYRLAWHKRTISPWSKPPAQTAPRTALDRIPILGWWRLRRESSLHGEGFWLRPMVIELGLAAGLVTLYWLEMQRGLYPLGSLPIADSVIRAQFLSHAILICFMTVATFIDLDEQTIPDEITIPGTLIGLLLAAVLPISLLPAWSELPPPIVTSPLWLSQPNPWPADLQGAKGLSIGLACIVGWWYAMLPKTLWYRSGSRKFVRYLLASIGRHRGTLLMTGLALATSAASVAVWWRGGLAWQGLLTSLVGMAAGGSVIWLVRIVASLALGQEAMGFGDVTLMGMIGAFVGWQPSLIIFFLAPFAGVIIAISQWILTQRKDIAYGPFLSLATILLILFWPAIWNRWGIPVFAMGWFVPLVFGVCLILLGILLVLIRAVRPR
ncbi:MAG: A24 family peptidase [Pirellulaceae bacterium]|nr:A24 family peptidase [Pirellulaceae bacterium]